MKIKLLWVTDPWKTLDHSKDTTLRWIEESCKLGIESHWCDVRSIHWLKGETLLVAQKVKGVSPGRAADAFDLAPKRVRSPLEFKRIIYRVDPPVNLKYLHPLQLLALATRASKSTEIVNSPSIIFSSSEKLEGSLVPGLMPPSVVACDWEILRNFGRREKATVLKPLHQAQSKGVELLRWDTPGEEAAAQDKLAAATEGFEQPVLLQRYLPGIVNGEQRLWFLNGKLLAVARKQPKPGEFKINMDQGGTLVVTTLNAREKRAAKRIGIELRRRRIRLAAVDLIDGYVTDHNFTSPGLIAQTEAVVGRNLSQPILRSLIRPWK